MNLRGFGIGAILLAASAAGLAAGEVGPEVYQRAATYTYGSSRRDLALIEEEVRTSTPEQYKAIAAKLVEAIKAPNATVDSKRYLLRMLGIAGSPQDIPLLAGYLKDENLSHAARYALEPMADPAAGEAIRQALGEVKGKLLLGMISSVEARRDAKAVGALSGLAGDSDLEVATAAVAALGEVGTKEAAKALEQAAAKGPEALGRPLARARVACAERLAAAGERAQAVEIYRSLMDPKQLTMFRIAGLKGLMAALERGEAVKLIAEMLQGDDAALKNATLSAFCTSTDKELKDAVVAQLPGFKPAAQAALLSLLGDQTDVNARAALLEIVQKGADPALRVAALECLATHGTGEDVPFLIKLAAKGEGPESAAARKTLDRMTGAGVNEALRLMLDTTDAGVRGMVLGICASRKVVAALPVLVKLMGGGDVSGALEAVKALEALGRADELAALCALMATTGDAGLREAAERSATAICARTSDKDGCAMNVLPALGKATSAAGSMAVLRLLPRVKTESALAAVRQAVNDKEAEVAEVAVSTLCDWPELAAAPLLLDLAKTTRNPTHAVRAIQGCLRLAGMRDKPMPERVGIYRSVLQAAKRPGDRARALAGAADIPSVEALELLRESLKNPDLAIEAAQALIRLAKQVGPLLGDQAVVALEDIKKVANASDQLKKAAEDAAKDAKNAGQVNGYIIAWLLAGPYTEQGKGGTELFDVAFPPEKPDAKNVEWRPCLVPPAVKMVQLDKILTGNERVAYLKAGIVSEKPQEVLLEVGSDDGVKIWVNGQVVHANNAVRGCQEGQDKVKVKLNQGPNTLLFKVTQGGGEWSLIARVRSASGGEPEGLMISAR